MINKLELKNKLLKITEKEVLNFLKRNPKLEFYAFAYECNADYGQVLLSFNTENEFEKILNGEDAKYYKNEEDIKDLKFSTGDWSYQDTYEISLFSKDEMNKIYHNLSNAEYKEQEEFSESIMQLITETLIEFRETDIYNRIPKTKDFISFSINHDEDFSDAMKRLKKYE